MLGRSGITYGPRGYSSPPTGLFSGRPQSMLSRAFARKSILRHRNWLLILVVCGLSALGGLLVWVGDPARTWSSGRRPAHLPEEAGCSTSSSAVPHGRRQACWTAGGCGRWRSLSTSPPRSPLLRRAQPLGSDINGAHAWIALPGGFQIEPSEYAKLALIVIVAMIFKPAR